MNLYLPLLSIFAQEATSTPTAEPTPIVEGPVADAVTNTYWCAESSALCLWIHQKTGSALLANWTATVLPALLKVFIMLVLTWFASKLVRYLVPKLFEAGLFGGTGLIGRSKGSTDKMTVRMRRKRAHTIGQIVGSGASILLWVAIIMMALSQLGLNIAPLLASAGIAGVALGFGAQSLVKDFLTGMFLTLEGQYTVGDWVVIGDAEGEVEEISLRVTRLRNTDGTLWFIPNGEITRVANQTHIWSRALLKVPMSSAIPVEMVKEMVDEANKIFMSEENVKKSVPETPEFFGISSFERIGPVYTVAVKCTPGSQWVIGRRYQTILKSVFDDHDIYETDGMVIAASEE